MKRITDSRVGELRIPAERFPLPPRVEELLRAYSGLGQWQGPPHSRGSMAVFQLPVYRLQEIEAAMLEDVAGDDGEEVERDEALPCRRCVEEAR